MQLRSLAKRKGGDGGQPRFTTSTLCFACILGFLIRDLWSTQLQSVALSSPSLELGLSQPMPASFGGIAGMNPLVIPTAPAVALPSVRVDDTNATYKREIYGGKGDKPHLGGFTELDPDGMSPALWKWMIEYVGVKSLLDVGCGRGTSTTWFQMHGVNASCVEGSHDAVENSFVADKSTVTEHDFSRGPWWPARTVDAIWSVELLEHIGRNFHENLIPAFRKAGVIFASHSTWGGWHHVEVHYADWWIYKFESYGFRYSPELTDLARGLAKSHKTDEMPNGQNYKAQHIWLHIMVFINPLVASLPEHHHLFAEPGCFDGKIKGGGVKKRDCGIGGKPQARAVESRIPDSFLPIKLNKAMDDEWERLIYGKTLDEYKKEDGAT